MPDEINELTLLKNLINDCYNQDKYIFVGQKNLTSQEERLLFSKAEEYLRNYYFSDFQCQVIFLAAVKAKQKNPNDTSDVVDEISSILKGFTLDKLTDIVTQLEQNNLLFVPKDNTGEKITRYNVNAVKCHALTPTKSYNALFNVCWKTYKEDFYGMSRANPSVQNRITSMPQRLYQIFFSHTYSSFYLDDDLRECASQSSASIYVLTFQEYRKYFVKLLNKIFDLIDAAENDITTNNDYLESIFNQWNLGISEDEKVVVRNRQLDYQRKTFNVGKIDEKPTPKFVFTDNGAELVIPQFKIDSPQIPVKFYIYIKDDCVKSGYISTTSGYIFSIDSHTMEESIPLNDFLKTDSSTVNFDLVLTYDNQEFKVHFKKRFLLFDFKKKQEIPLNNNEVSLPDGYYYLYSLLPDSHLFNKPSSLQIWEPGSNVYIFKAREGDAPFKLEDCIIYFFNSEVSDSPYFIFGEKCDLLYELRGVYYPVALSIPKIKSSPKINLRNYWLKINGKRIEKRILTHSTYQGKYEVYDISSCIEKDDIAATIELVDQNDRVVDKFYLLKDVKVLFDKDFYFPDVDSKITATLYYGSLLIMQKIFPLSEADNISFKYQYGNIIAKCPSLFSFKINKDDNYKNQNLYDPLTNLKRNDLTNNFTITLYPDDVSYELFVNGKQLQEGSKKNTYDVGQHVYALIDFEAKVTARYEDREILLMDINLSDIFSSSPLEIDGKNRKIYWNPAPQLLNESEAHNMIFWLYISDVQKPREKIFLEELNSSESAEIFLSRVKYQSGEYYILLEQPIFEDSPYGTPIFHRTVILGDESENKFLNSGLRISKAKKENGDIVEISPSFSLFDVRYIADLSSNNREEIPMCVTRFIRFDYLYFQTLYTTNHDRVEISNMFFIEKENGISIEVNDTNAKRFVFCLSNDDNHLVLKRQNEEVDSNLYSKIDYFIYNFVRVK